MSTLPSSLRSLLPRDLRVSPLGRLAYAVAGGVAVLDQLSKWLIVHVVRLPERLQVPVAPPVFNLTMVWNHGVTFGAFRNSGEVGRWALVAVATGVVLVLANVARTAERRLLAVGLGLILGGAVGNNLIDRVLLGAVADFFDFSGLSFPWVFNVADIAIDLGIACLAADMLGTQPERTAG
jgi:signal peptidase II